MRRSGRLCGAVVSVPSLDIAGTQKSPQLRAFLRTP